MGSVREGLWSAFFISAKEILLESVSKNQINFLQTRMHVKLLKGLLEVPGLKFPIFTNNKCRYVYLDNSQFRAQLHFIFQSFISPPQKYRIHCSHPAKNKNIPLLWFETQIWIDLSINSSSIHRRMLQTHALYILINCPLSGWILINFSCSSSRSCIDMRGVVYIMCKYIFKKNSGDTRWFIHFVPKVAGAAECIINFEWTNRAFELSV